MRYYLWWAKQGTPPVKHVSVPAGGVIVRAVRHHDDHSLLLAGDLADYCELTQSDIEDETLVGQPWTAQQLQFVGGTDPVRVAVGRPGSGKSTVLWKAIEGRPDETVLYLTWSPHLLSVAEAHLSAFAPESVKVIPREFSALFAEVRDADVARLTLRQSEERFRDLFSGLGARELGPWKDHINALYAEVRSHLIGHAIPGLPTVKRHHGVCRLLDDEYVRQVVSPRGLDAGTARALLRLVKRINIATDLATVFPELAAAGDAIQALDGGALPEGYEQIDRVVIDEAQDLTLVEFAAIVRLIRCIAKRRGTAPVLLIAGDEGQTVRPTAFEWATFKDHLSAELAQPRTVHLEENLRSPAGIVKVLQRASDRYSELPKHRRPGDQYRMAGSQHWSAPLIHVEIDGIDDARTLLNRLDDVEDLVVVSAQESTPGWVDGSGSDAGLVVTPADVKGLEYEKVCVLNPGHTLVRLDVDLEGASHLDLLTHRSALDQVRVALSRATECLVFIDVQPDSKARTHSLDLLGECIRFDGDELVDYLTSEASTADERVRARIGEAKRMLERRPDRAWRKAQQAVALLGDPGLPNGVADPELRTAATQVLLEVGANLLLTSHDVEIEDAEVVAAVRKTLPRCAQDVKAFEILCNWLTGEAGCTIDLIEAAADCGPWLQKPLRTQKKALREKLNEAARDLRTAPRFAGDIEGWLKVIGFSGDKPAAARRLRRLAFDCLLESPRGYSAAETLFRTLDPPDDSWLGRLREAQGRHKEAGEAFERADLPVQASRNHRLAGLWERSLPHALGREHADLAWLQAVEEVITARPNGHHERLTTAERKRLAATLKAVSGSSQ